MEEENKKIAHLNIIQGVITRMGNNSFMLKGWGSGVMIAIYAFAGNQAHKAVIVTLIPITVLWLLDTYYLTLERKYRELYNNVIEKDNKDIDYKMNFNEVDIKIQNIGKLSFFKIMFSKSIFPFYTACIITTLIVYFKKF